MWYQVFIPAPVLMIPILVMTTKGTHSPKNDSGLPSDVIVTYSNHAEAPSDDRILQDRDASSTTAPTTVVTIESRNKIQNLKKPVAVPRHRPKNERVRVEDSPEEGVLFIPNERERDVVRNEDYLQNERASLRDLMGGHRTVEDLLANKDVRLETESPVSDIIFVMGKNNENIEHPDNKDEDKKLSEGEMQAKATTAAAPKLDCANLNCSNAIISICGEKIENYQKRFRLFLNECYFRKVNCNFKSAANRYKRVSLEKCRHIGAHYNQTPFYKPPRRMEAIVPVQVNNTRKFSASSRRSMSMNINGQFCSHTCPVSCPELYEPECAVSSSGQHRVFVNHCALDHNSCSFGTVWHSVPLSQCVGGHKADMRQNAGFIGWMQRVGIVDKKGRLVYDTEER